MTGLKLSKMYWEVIGIPSFMRECPDVLRHAAVGLVGEGSECFGCDDEVSRDHDWGPGFCMWLNDADYEMYGAAAGEVYAKMPDTFMGYKRQRQTSYTQGRVGVMSVGSFYSRYLGANKPPETIREWRYIPENALSVVTNGQVFVDNDGSFTEFRDFLLNYYPEDLRKKKLAKYCALAAQQGQYNYSRCLKHGEEVSALIALGQFIEDMHKIAFLLSKKYCPYYKWSQRLMKQLPDPWPNAAELIDRLTLEEEKSKASVIEYISGIVIRELQKQGLSDIRSDYLLDHAAVIQSKIEDPTLARLHIMAE